MTQKYSDATTPISNLISIGELLWDSSFIYGELLRITVAIQKRPLLLEDERILNDWEELNEFFWSKKRSQRIQKHLKMARYEAFLSITH